MQKGKRKLKKPSLNEVIDYFISKGSDEKLARIAFDYYDAGDWTDSRGKAVINWRQKVLINWIKNPINKPKLHQSDNRGLQAALSFSKVRFQA